MHLLLKKGRESTASDQLRMRGEHTEMPLLVTVQVRATDGHVQVQAGWQVGVSVKHRGQGRRQREQRE